MSFANGGDPGTSNRPAHGGFDFQLRQSSEGDAARRKRRAGVDHRAATSALVVVGLAVVALAGAGATGWFLVQQSEDQVRADSAAFCANLATTPGVLDTAAYGWPTEAATQEEFIAAMRAYSDRWTNLAAIAHPTIRPDLAAIGTAAAKIADNVETTKTNDRAGNLERMRSVTSKANVKPWATKYCA